MKLWLVTPRNTENLLHHSFQLLRLLVRHATAVHSLALDVAIENNDCLTPREAPKARFIVEKTNYANIV